MAKGQVRKNKETKKPKKEKVVAPAGIGTGAIAAASKKK